MSEVRIQIARSHEGPNLYSSRVKALIYFVESIFSQLISVSK